MKKSVIVTICSVCSVLVAAGVAFTAVALKRKHSSEKPSSDGDEDFVTEDLPDNARHQLAGGFTFAEASGAGLTEEEQQIFEASQEGICGASYKPLCLLGTQVVAGMNYAFLCKSTTLYSDVPSIVICTVYRDLKGNTLLTGVQSLEDCLTKTDTDVETSAVQEKMTVTYEGGWSINLDAVFADNSLANRALGKAVTELSDFNYEEVAYLGSQVVAGRNYAFILLETPVKEKSAPRLVYVKIYEDLKGNAHLTEKYLLRLGQE